jgi:CRISPR type I-E-associated protein CasB/Cse2
MSEQPAAGPGSAPIGKTVGAWWRDLDARDRAGRARLRRADLDAAMIDEATLRLFARLGDRTPEALSRVAVLAMVLAAVGKDTGRDRVVLARQLGFAKVPDDPEKPAADNKPVLSVLRFRRLMSAADDADLARQFRRAVDLLGGEANAGDIGCVLLGWDQPTTRRDFAFNYFGGGIAAPSVDPGEEDDPVDAPDAAPSA